MIDRDDYAEMSVDQLWALRVAVGRGKTPRWVSDLLAAGKSMSDLQIPDLIARI